MLNQEEYDLQMIRLANANIDLGNGVDKSARVIIEASKHIEPELEKAKKEFLKVVSEWNKQKEMERGVKMPRKKKYENAEIVKGILSREASAMGDMQFCISIKFVDFKSKEDRKFLANNIRDMMDLFADALKELEED